MLDIRRIDLVFVFLRFFIGACMMIESIHQIRTNRIMKSLLSNAFTSSLVLTSLLAYYALWLSTTSTNVGEAGYWALLKFPILPTSLNNLKLVIRMLSEFCVFYRAIAIIFYTIVLFYLFLCIKQKKDLKNHFTLCGSFFSFINSILYGILSYSRKNSSNVSINSSNYSSILFK